MKLKELMTSNVHTIEANASIREAAEQMANLDVGALPVTESGKLVGVITDRDIAVRAVAKGLDPRKAKVRGAMTAEIESAPDDTEVEDAVQIMESRQIRRLLVTDESGKLDGILSLGDLATRCRDKAPSAEALEAISQPTASA